MTRTHTSRLLCGSGSMGPFLIGRGNDNIDNLALCFSQHTTLKIVR